MATASKGWHSRGYLPHFDSPETVQALTFRLADSLPKPVFVQMGGAPLAPQGQRWVEDILDEGRGGCILRKPAVAKIAADALGHFDGERYQLLAWVLMPNHVHVLIEQVSGFRLGDIVHSWKSFTAKAINLQEKTKGPVWAPDYFDRFIRDEIHYANALHYIEQNPVRAGLVGRAEEWPYSSAKRE